MQSLFVTGLQCRMVYLTKQLLDCPNPSVSPFLSHTPLQVFMGAAALADIMQDQGDAWVSAREWAEDPTRAAARCGSN